jgi:hypothetical protein
MYHRSSFCGLKRATTEGHSAVTLHKFKRRSIRRMGGAGARQNHTDTNGSWELRDGDDDYDADSVHESDWRCYDRLLPLPLRPQSTAKSESDKQQPPSAPFRRTPFSV